MSRGVAGWWISVVKSLRTVFVVDKKRKQTLVDFCAENALQKSACTFFTVQSCTDRRSETETENQKQILETRNGTLHLAGWLKTISENLTPPLQNQNNTSPATVRTVP